MLPQQTAYSQAFPRGLDRLKVWHLAGFANTFAEQTWINLSARKANNSKDEGSEKSKEKFISGASSQEWQAQAFIDFSSHKMNT